MTSRSQRVWLVGLVASSVAGVVLSYSVATHLAILGSRWALLDRLAIWAGVWAVGVVCALRLHLPRRRVVALVLVAGVALRVAALAGPPRLSDDMYRYSWDARVQLTGTDPYRYRPDSPAERYLREGWLWPDAAGCAVLHRGVGCSRINRPDVRTIYPPVAEAWFTTVYRLGGGVGSRHKLWQAAGLATEIGTLAVLTRLLVRRGRDPRWVALYALSPAPVVEIVNNGHVDGLGALALLAALLALGGEADRPRAGWRAPAAGVLIGVATLVKLYPLVALLPFCTARGLRLRERVAVAAGAVGVIVVGYLPHVLAVGPKVIGYLPGYLKEEKYTGTAQRFLLATLAHRSPHGTDVVVAVAVLAVLVLVVLVRPDPAVGTAAVVGVLLLAANPVQPWYGVTLLALATVAVQPRWALVVAAGYPYFFAVILADRPRHQLLVGRASYGAAAVGVVILTVVGWRRQQHRPPGQLLGVPATRSTDSSR